MKLSNNIIDKDTWNKKIDKQDWADEFSSINNEVISMMGTMVPPSDTTLNNLTMKQILDK